MRGRRFDREVLDDCASPSPGRISAGRSIPARSTPSARVSSMFLASENEGTAARPRRSSGTNRRPIARRRRGRARVMSLPKSAIVPGSPRASSPEIAARSLAPARAFRRRNAGDADHLAGAHRQLDARERYAERVAPREAQPADRRGDLVRASAGCARRRPARRRSSCARGWRWSARAARHSPVHLARAKDRGNGRRARGSPPACGSRRGWSTPATRACGAPRRASRPTADRARSSARRG